MRLLFAIKLLVLLVFVKPTESRCQGTLRYIFDTYSQNYGAPIKINQGDTVVFKTEGYFINNKRAELYNKLHHSYIDGNYELTALLFDLQEYLESEETFYNQFSYDLEAINNKLSALEEEVKGIKPIKVDVPKIVEVPAKPKNIWIVALAGLAAGVAVGLGL